MHIVGLSSCIEPCFPQSAAEIALFLESESCACQEQESSTEESFLSDVQLPLAQTNQAQRIGGTRLREEVNILFSSLLACCFTTVCPQEVFLRIFLWYSARHPCFSQSQVFLLSVIHLICCNTAFTACLCYPVLPCFFQDRQFHFLNSAAVGSHLLLPVCVKLQLGACSSYLGG